MCSFFQLDSSFTSSRLIAPGDIFVIAGNISMNQTDYGDEVKGSFRRNVVSVIPNWKFNASTGDNDIALLKVGKFLKLESVRLKIVP